MRTFRDHLGRETTREKRLGAKRPGRETSVYRADREGVRYVTGMCERTGMCEIYLL